jgi:GNAT superfamily N-acetyltransferase
MVRVLEGSHLEDRGDHLVVASPGNQDFWWGNFLLLRELAPGSGPSWLARFAAEFPAARHVAIGVVASDAGTLNPGELIGCGLSLDVDSVLTARSLHEPSHLNTEVVIRPLAGDDDWQQAVALRAAINVGTAGDDLKFTTARIAAERAMCEAGRATWYGAFLDRALAAQLGLVTGDGRRERLARYQNVETHPSARRQGLAGTLVWHAGQAALASGVPELVIVADPDYHAMRLYESVGFTVTQDQISFSRQPPDDLGGSAPGG